MKWGGAVATVLFLVVWVGSGWLAVGRFGRKYHGLVAGGCVVIEWPNDPRSDFAAPGWIVKPHSWRVASWRPFLNDRSAWARLYLPLWFVALPPAALAAGAWRLDALARRRARLNLCLKCNYDRTGLAPEAVCPECGQGART